MPVRQQNMGVNRMERSLVVVLPGLPEDLAGQIRESAGRHGFVCRFFDHSSESLPYLSEAEIIFGGSPFLSRNAPALRWMCLPSAGADPFVRDDAFANPSALLTNSSGAYGVTISEHIVMLILEILRREPEYQAHVREKAWVRQLPVRSIFGSRITLLGTGDIGRAALRCLRGFRPAQIVGVNRSGRNPDSLFDRVLPGSALDAVLPETDLLIISLPGTGETHHMISEKQLKLLPDGAVIINVGRGAVIDQAALERELRGGRLFAGLDVFETEPIPAESTLWNCPRLIITPHVAGDTSLPYTFRRIVELFLEDFENYCAGRPLSRLVDRGAGY